MDKDIIMLKSDLIKLVKEESKPKGLTDTERIQKQSKAINKDYYKKTAKKVEDTTKTNLDKVDSDITPPKRELDKDEEEIANMTHGLGMEDLVYDSVVDDTFKDRQKKAIEGDSSMGNKTYEGEWDPETGSGNGNTEEVWGASGGKKTGEAITKTAKKRKEIEDKIEPQTQFGKVVTKNPNYKGKTVGQGKQIASEAKIKNSKTKKTMKKLNFKKPLENIVIAKGLIPENYKTNDNVFIMSDGTHSYKIKWEGNLTEGKAIELSSENKTLMTEEMLKIKHLMGYKSNDKNISGIVKGNERIDENKIFFDTLSKKKTLIKESYVFNHTLQGSEATEENAKAHAMGLDWHHMEATAQEINSEFTQHIETVNGVGIYYDYAADYYFFTDEEQGYDEAEMRAQYTCPICGEDRGSCSHG